MKQRVFTVCRRLTGGCIKINDPACLTEKPRQGMENYPDDKD
jgi:hypothetical protein